MLWLDITTKEEKMSWTGTVTCSHCYQQGHNQRGCGGYKKYLKESLQEAKDNDNEYRTSHYERLIKENSSRQCGYCKNSYGEGDLERHSKATCPKRLENFAKESEECFQQRRRLVARWDDIGFGIGALLSIRVYCREIYDYRAVTALVTHIDFTQITNRSVETHTFNDRAVVTVSYFDQHDKERKETVSLPIRATWFTDASLEEAIQTSRIVDSCHDGCKVDVLSGVVPSVPETFLDAKQIKKAVKPYVDDFMSA
jgi:hypothetical protein